MTAPLLRPALPQDIPAIAQIWHAGWHEAHASLVPTALTERRTLESMTTRSETHLHRTTLACDAAQGDILGLVMVKNAELFQLYAAPAARGRGVAAALIAAGEQQLAAAGVDRAHLSCAIGNARAARFYEKTGWVHASTVVDQLETSAGLFSLDVWRYEKDLSASL